MNPAVELERRQGASTLYVFFGGMAAGIVIPPFEFYRASRILDAHRLFVRDFHQCWYHLGIRGVSRDIPSTVGWLRGQIAELAPTRTVLVGNSMGGFAALLFGALLADVEVIAFAPQTFVSPCLRWRHHDCRWPRKIHRLWRQSWFRPHCWDLRRRLSTRRRALGDCDSRPGAAGRWPPFMIYASPSDPLDWVHAQHLSEVPGLCVHCVAEGGHDLVRTLRDQRLLPAIMAGG